jgi:leucine dehydrogenase
MDSVAIEPLAVDGYDEVYRLEVGGVVAFVALHAVLAGRSFGGIRIRKYASEADALDDALALSRAMSRKVVLAGLRGGGGKSVILEPESGADRAACVRALGLFIEELGGRYCCGPDMGFTRADDDALRSATQYVACEGMSAATAQGVLTAMRHVAGPLERVAIQGLGAVGQPLAEILSDSSVDVVACDVRPVAEFESVPLTDIYDVECDVFSPCAGGGVLNATTIPRLRCRVVCGGANNPMATDADVIRLHERGIQYVPDIISNAGATVVGASTALKEPHLIESRLAAIGPLAEEVCRKATEADLPSHEIALQIADERLRDLRAENI